MMLNELFTLKRFTATVRVKTTNFTGTANTAIYADGPAQARALLTAKYGEGNVLSVTLCEAARTPQGTQTLNAEQLAKKSVKDARERTAASEEAARLSRKIVTAQNKATKDAAKRFRAFQ